MNEASEAQSAEIVVLDSLKLEPDPREVARYLGHPVAAGREDWILRRVCRAIELSRDSLRPRGLYAVHAVFSSMPQQLRLACGAVFTGPIGELLGPVNRVAVFLATAGQIIARQAEDSLHAGETLDSLIFDAIGSHVADAVAACIAKDLRGKLDPGEAVTTPVSPGYCGVPLSQQRTIFKLLDAARIGVELLPSMFMKPAKSVSGLFGLGAVGVVAAAQNPCDCCAMIDCKMRRQLGTMVDR